MNLVRLTVSTALTGYGVYMLRVNTYEDREIQSTNGRLSNIQREIARYYKGYHTILMIWSSDVIMKQKKEKNTTPQEE